MLIVYVHGSKGTYSFVAEKNGEIFKIGIFKKVGITPYQAKYLAIREVLKIFPKSELLIYCDSKFILNQLEKEIEIRNRKLKLLVNDINRRMTKKIKIKWIPTYQNKARKIF